MKNLGGEAIRACNEGSWDEQRGRGGKGDICINGI